ncbi:MAG: DUF3794 domain-containing protein [Oscillospiraceae bacterium]|nr:DUF3794 domain-containing protein [Oscillospiraceae bacterium]
MELSFDRNSMECWEESFSQTLRKEDSQDSVVPDTMPDIGGLVCCTGTPLIRGKDVTEGRVRLEANIPAKAVYTPEEGGGLYVLEVNLPLYVSFEDTGIAADSVCVAEIELAALEARTLNPRKISVRAETVFRVRCFTPAQIQSVGAPAGETEGIHLLERVGAVTPLCAVTEKTFVLTDEFQLGAEQPDMARILSQSILPQVEEIRCVGGKLVVKGNVRSCLTYASAEGEGGSLRLETGFSQVVDAGELPEESHAVVSLLVSGAYFEPGPDGRGGTAEIHMVLQAMVYGKTGVTSVVDAYSARYPLELEREPLETGGIQTELSLRESFHETVPAPQSVGEILGAQLRPGLPAVEEGTVALPVTADIFYETTEGELCSVRRDFIWHLTQGLEPGQSLEVTAVALSEPALSPAAGGIELRVSAEVRAFLRQTQETERITGLRYDEDAAPDLSELPSLVLLRASNRDDLWTLAKENCSTVAAISEANGLDSLGAVWEKLILIPKCV